MLTMFLVLPLYIIDTVLVFIGIYIYIYATDSLQHHSVVLDTYWAVLIPYTASYYQS